MNTQYTITELAREFDVTPRAIRFYEDQGLLSPSREGSSGLRRVYSGRDRTRLKLTLRGKRLGFTLSEIRDLLDVYESPTDTRAAIARLPCHGGTPSRRTRTSTGRPERDARRPRAIRNPGAHTAGERRTRDQVCLSGECTVDMNHFPKLLSSQIGFDIAQTMLEGFDRHYRVFRDAAIHAKTAFRSRRLAWPANAGARAHYLIRRARRGMRRTARRRIRRREYRRRSVAADQAPLHRPPDHAPPARVRGDVLQLGVLQDPAPFVLQQ